MHVALFFDNILTLIDWFFSICVRAMHDMQSTINMVHIADLYCCMFILLFQGSAMVNHIRIVYSWYAPPGRLLYFFLLTHNRGELNHSYKLLNATIVVESTKNANQPLTHNFEPKYFRTMPINQTGL